MKKVFDWFLKQTTPAKFSITFVTIAIVIAAVSTVIGFLSNLTTPAPAPKPTATAQPTQTPTPTPTPTQTGTPGSTDYEVDKSETQGQLFPYGEASFAAAMVLTQNADLEQCKIIPNETNASKIARMSPYMPQVATYVDGGYFDNWSETYKRSCILLSPNFAGYYAATDTVEFMMKNTSLNIAKTEATKPETQQAIVRELLDYQYTLKHNSDGSWTIQGIGR